MQTFVPTLLRTRFTDVEQLHNHLHVTEGRTLFFFRGNQAALSAGNRVMVQFLLANGQVSTQRGSVIGHVDGDQTGAWIEFPDSRLAKKLDQGLRSRGQPRIGCDLIVEVRQDGDPCVARIVDVSLAAMRVVGAAGLRKGPPVDARLIGAGPAYPPQLGRAEVVRADANGTDVALKFVRADPAARIASTRLLQAVHEPWTRAPELTHPQMCCQGGRILEPPVPHIKSRL
ncbi:MAG TPA: PilZ domain-containing protein [Myxococcales bacterium]|nr:PilZ domain-containing protein [Myxococcales bacterium]